MNIALLVNPENPCPPTHYGGSERRAAIYAKMLIGRKHVVEVFCQNGSQVIATRCIGVPRGMVNQKIYVNEIRRLQQTNWTYDVALDMTPFHVGSALPELKVVSIMGGDPLKKYPHDEVRNRVYVSPQLADHFGCSSHPIVHNIVHSDPESIPLGGGQGTYALYVGAIRPEKGIYDAAMALKIVDIPLWVFGPKTDARYYEMIRHDITYCGMLPAEGVSRWRIFQNAHVFMYPISWCDAGPLAPMEAMLVGTPVVARQNGGIIQDLEEGISGYWWDEDAPEKSITQALSLDREKVRRSILPKINPVEAVDKIEGLLRRAADGEEW